MELRWAEGGGGAYINLVINKTVRINCQDRADSAYEGRGHEVTSFMGITLNLWFIQDSIINYIAKKIKRSIGILSKLRYFLYTKTIP